MLFMNVSKNKHIQNEWIFVFYPCKIGTILVQWGMTLIV